MKRTKRKTAARRVGCDSCKLPYTDPGFCDLIIPNWAWEKISPTGNLGGLLCPTCICAALAENKITCEGAFMSGPIRSVTETTMTNLRQIENLTARVEALDGQR